MIQDRLNDKEHDIQGVQKQSSELLSIAWQKGYQAGFNDGYDTRREVDQRPQGEWIVLVDEDNIKTCKCSICGRMADIVDFNNYPFCHCGAKMKGGVS